MKKGIKKGIFGVAFSLMVMGTTMSSYAGTWQSDANGWWWKNDDGSYPVSTWKWIDGNSDGVAECFYFDANGYCLLNTTTPDQYTVNKNGAWVVNGVVQTQGAAVTENQTAKANLQDIIPDASFSYVASFENNLTYGGENWNGASQYKAGFGSGNAFADFYLGKKYTKLTFKAVPRVDDARFSENNTDLMTISDQQTGEVLAEREIDFDTKKFTMEVDVTGVEYLRINVQSRGWGVFGTVMIKDAMLY